MITDARKSPFWKTLEYCFYFFFISFPFIHYTSFLYSGTSTRSLNLVVFAALLGIALGIWLLTKKASLSFIKSPLVLALAIYFACLCVSGFLGLSFATSFWSVATRMTGIWYLLSLGIFMALLWAIIADEARHHRFILGIIISTALYSVLDLFSTDGIGPLAAHATYDGFTFGNSTFAGMYIFAAFLLSIYYLLQTEKRKWWMYLLPIVLLINPNIINSHMFLGDFSGGIIGDALASSYAIILSIFMLLGMWGVSKMRNAKQRTYVSYGLFGTGIVVVALATFSLFSPSGFLREAYLSKATPARPLVWQLSERAIAERPFFGYGGDNFERVFEKYYDNRLLQQAYGNEAWFDRAHNVFIDESVDNGLVGLAAYLAVYLVLILALIYTILHADERRDRIFASVLVAYFTLHIAELQTAFDTSISYPLLAFMFVSAAVLYQRTRSQQVKKDLTIELPRMGRYALGAALIGFSVWSLAIGAYPLARAQIANGAIRTAGSTAKRLPLYGALFGSRVDEQAFLWRTVTDFERGISQDPKVLENPKKAAGLEQELVIFENGYGDYVKAHPDNFRARLNLADVLMYQNLFSVDKLHEAQDELDKAIKLTPQSPQPYWMKAVGYIYMKKFDLAQEYAQKGLALNPDIKQSQDVVDYVNSSIKTFPNIDLFFFSQI